MGRTIRVIAGVLLIGLGLVGMLVPVLPGIPLLVAGVTLLGSNHPWVRPLLARLRLWRRKGTRAAGPRHPDESERRNGGVSGR
jgi:uncharacterized membrane protein YbaN (DUF454 family)